ncbi:cysteine--tRNA ligase [Candidatus Albibeggiatoa sp. nov. NOAA]|uniref:cysteine--tRNA ligase n=1 Tax=Candidatus Albibeggiatoa sp. nov. NOAA TaxID=3162724 RepID=UPI0032FA2081|nr:cysteine--tRNA ligase [Thiotrichaceae bacterium]
MLSIYNSLSKQKEVFKPIQEGKVNMYVCGMTVYDYCHIGHARVMVVFDTIVRYLREIGYDVNYIRNITDIDDKIIQRANENGEDFHNLTTRFIQAMHEDSNALGVLPPDSEPKATESIEDITNLIQKLFDNGYAYQADNGDVYYAVNKFEQYGKLSGKKLDDLRAGERVDVDNNKQDPLDFVLWKSAKPEEPSWESPWGNGRPGWHIECSAMSTSCLGNHFDIHGGGADLQFPHHENEIAQSEGATGEQYVNYWVHNGFVRVNEEKMSKSLGNFFTVREVLDKYQPEVVRYFILGSHYRSPLNYSDQHLDNAQQALTRLYTALRGLPVSEESDDDNSYYERFHEAMDDDFNTADALAVLFDLARDINKIREQDIKKATLLANELRQLGLILGLLQSDPEQFLQQLGGEVELSAEAIDDLIAQRNAARANKDWAEADRIRDELKDKGVTLEDGAGGTTWRRG